MRHLETLLRLLIVVLVTLAACAHAAGPAPGPTFSAAQLRDDVAALARALRDMPPDLAHSADPQQVTAALGSLERQIDATAPLDRDAAWRLFATLNPLLGDGHLFVGFVDWRADARAHLAAGGVFFPFEMQVAPHGELYVRRALGGAPDALDGDRVQAINGVDAGTVSGALLARVHGDTPAFRAALLSRRFWFYYWKVYGSPAVFDLAIAGQKDSRTVAGSAALPAVLADEDSFERQFRLELLPNDAALLTVSSFAWGDKQQFLAFTHDAFATLRAAKPYRWASRFRKRVVVADERKHEAVGDIVNGEVETWIPPQPENPLRFSGRTYVLVGTATYSSAIVFSNVMQDFGFGIIAGTGGSVRSATTGGTRRTTLPNCGLIVIAPRFVLWRPSGAREPALLTPQLQVADDPFDPAAAVAEVLRSAAPIKNAR
jgi:hypothetical protein